METNNVFDSNVGTDYKIITDMADPTWINTWGIAGTSFTGDVFAPIMTLDERYGKKLKQPKTDWQYCAFNLILNNTNSPLLVRNLFWDGKTQLFVMDYQAYERNTNV